MEAWNKVDQNHKVLEMFLSESKGGVQERNQSTMHAQSCEYEACKEVG